MATAKRNYFPDLASNVIRPALVEAMLLTEKHAGDAVYMATLAEELRNVEAKIAAMEEVTQFGSSATAAQSGSFLSPGDRVEAQWIRTKSRELDARLRHIERTFNDRQGLKIARSTEHSPGPASLAARHSAASERAEPASRKAPRS